MIDAVLGPILAVVAVIIAIPLIFVGILTFFFYREDKRKENRDKIDRSH
ncbi:tellurite resistance protein TehA-like permease [Paenibacillus mucilaginosus]